MTVSSDSLRRTLEAVDRIPRVVHRRLSEEMKGWGEDWSERVKSRFGSGDGLNVLTGRLRDSVTYSMSPGSSLADLRLRGVSEGVIYARIQEFGGVIKPVNARFLTIPLEGNKTAGGETRYPSARQFIDAHPGETYFVRLPEGDLLLVWKKPTIAARTRFASTPFERNSKVAEGVGVAMWKLVRQVEIPGPLAPTKKRPSRFGFFDSWHDLAQDRRAGLLEIGEAA